MSFGAVLIRVVLRKDDSVMDQADKEGGGDTGRRRGHRSVSVERMTQTKDDPFLGSGNVRVLQVPCPF